MSVQFFEQTHPVAALLSTIALFTAGFLIRPFGAFLFGWLGDRVGRKYTFLITLTGMGLGTGAIGLIPSFESIGLTAAVPPFALRMIQGLCLGGEYGGAITYVAEHVSDERRGFYTGWLQTSPTLGIVVSMVVIVGTRAYLGDRGVQRLGVAHPVPGFLPAGGNRDLHPPATAGDADLPGDQGQGPDDQEPVAGGVPQPQYEVRADRQHRGDRAGSGLVQRPVLGAVLPAAGIQGRRGDLELHRGSRAAPCNADLDLLWLAVRPDRPQAGDPGRHAARGGHLLSPVFMAGRVTLPDNINYPVAIFIIFILVSYVGMVYGPIGAFLAEYFPGRIRYTSVSVPYHIGNGWGGGSCRSSPRRLSGHGSLGYALIYPIAVPAGVLRARTLSDAGDPSHQHLGAGTG